MQHWKSKRGGVLWGETWEAESVAAVDKESLLEEHLLKIALHPPNASAASISYQTLCPVRVQNWDDEVIAMLDRCPSDKCFISHYPPAHNDTGSVQVPDLTQAFALSRHCN